MTASVWSDFQRSVPGGETADQQMPERVRQAPAGPPSPPGGRSAGSGQEVQTRQGRRPPTPGPLRGFRQKIPLPFFCISSHFICMLLFLTGFLKDF